MLVVVGKLLAGEAWTAFGGRWLHQVHCDVVYGVRFSALSADGWLILATIK